MRCLLVCLCALLLFPATALSASSSLPVEIHTAQGIKYYNGGVGIDERTRMPQLYALKIVFATEQGLYLNDAEVRILAAGGKEVLRVRAANGPWLITDLPSGTYTLEATIEGRTVTRRGVRVTDGSKEVAILRWKSSEVDMGL